MPHASSQKFSCLGGRLHIASQYVSQRHRFRLTGTRPVRRCSATYTSSMSSRCPGPPGDIIARGHGSIGQADVPLRWCYAGIALPWPCGRLGLVEHELDPRCHPRRMRRSSRSDLELQSESPQDVGGCAAEAGQICIRIVKELVADIGAMPKLRSDPADPALLGPLEEGCVRRDGNGQPKRPAPAEVTEHHAPEPSQPGVPRCSCLDCSMLVRTS